MNLQKMIWTEKDFDQMDWHDCKIHALSFGIKEYEIAFDIDYIVEWNSPTSEISNYHFLVSPATLIFKNVYDLNLDSLGVDIIIDDISRSNQAKPKNSDHIQEKYEYDWLIDIVQGHISFKSVGFIQYLRSTPILTNNQFLSISERGGISFAI